MECKERKGENVELYGENVEICGENVKVTKEDDNYETYSEEWAPIDVLDHEASLK
jgi:hypothetical protein